MSCRAYNLLKGILNQLHYLGGIGPLCTHIQVLATWTHLNGWLEHDVFAIGLQHTEEQGYPNGTLELKAQSDIRPRGIR